MKRMETPDESDAAFDVSGRASAKSVQADAPPSDGKSLDNESYVRAGHIRPHSCCCLVCSRSKFASSQIHKFTPRH